MGAGQGWGKTEGSCPTYWLLYTVDDQLQTVDPWTVLGGGQCQPRGLRGGGGESARITLSRCRRP
eukprot:9433076-Pyramimonas_sp.AAC.1